VAPIHATQSGGKPRLSEKETPKIQQLVVALHKDKTPMLFLGVIFSIFFSFVKMDLGSTTSVVVTSGRTVKRNAGGSKWDV